MIAETLSFINPKILVKLDNLLLKAKLSVESYLSGIHHSRSKGSSVDFAEHRQYTKGDEIKYLDWKVYAKSDRFYIKEYQQETNLKIYILLDTSKSMEYSSSSYTKFQYAVYLASAISYMAIKQKNSVGLIAFSDSIKEHIPPRSSFEHLKIIIRTIEKLKTSGKTNIGYTINELGNIIKKRALIVLVSDLFDKEQEIINSLKLLKARRCEIFVLHLLDTVEIDLSLNDNFNFICNETNKNITADTRVIREEYKKLINKFIEKLKTSCYQNSIDYLLINTSLNKLVI